MEHTGRQTGWKSGHMRSRSRSGVRLLQGVLLVSAAFLAGRIPMLGECFPIAIALTSCLVCRNPGYLYLAIPAGAGILSCIRTGCDSWSELVAMVGSVFLFVIVRNIRLEVWQCAVINGSIGIVCLSIYRLVTGTVNRTDATALVLEGLMIAVCFLLLDSFFRAAKDGMCNVLSLAGATMVWLLFFCGTGIGFFFWPAVIFFLLCVLCFGKPGDTAVVITVSGLLAALIGQTQWGFMVSLLIGVCSGGFFHRFGAGVKVLVFFSVCWALQAVESGLILGVDRYCLLLGCAFFAAVSWKCSPLLQRMIRIFSGEAADPVKQRSGRISRMLQEQEREMQDLAELYDTYVDSRSLLAAQFGVTRQMLEHTRWQLERTLQKNAGKEKEQTLRKERFRMEISASQCAAAGSINGDCCGWQDLGDGRTALVISDGMGKGKKAAAESLLVTRTLLGLLKAGAGTELTLKMINTIMMMKEGEDSFATVDLAIVDRIRGRAGCYKIGAAPTLIRRKNNIEEVQLSAIPLGIVNGLEIRSVEVSLKKGDLLIMMSDGVSDGPCGKGFLPRLKEILCEIHSEDPAVICDLVLGQVTDSYLGQERDDLTIMTAKML